ncbi:MAG: hypothetical protein ACOCXP_00615 [Candidatus Dojkabacteria bacterium]
MPNITGGLGEGELRWGYQDYHRELVTYLRLSSLFEDTGDDMVLRQILSSKFSLIGNDFWEYLAGSYSSEYLPPKLPKTQSTFFPYQYEDVSIIDLFQFHDVIKRPVGQMRILSDLEGVKGFRIDQFSHRQIATEALFYIYGNCLRSYWTKRGTVIS